MSPNSTGHRHDSLNISALTAYLWDAANILRGPVDAADFKTYIFPLLFFKRLSDVYDEEYTVALDESGVMVKSGVWQLDHAAPASFSAAPT